MSDWRHGRVLVVKVELTRSSLLEELATAMAQELMQTDLNLECLVGVLLVKILLVVFDERNLLIGSLGGENVAERDVLEAKVLSNVVVVGDVDPCGDTATCQ
jgi:hypothetical protein